MDRNSELFEKFFSDTSTPKENEELFDLLERQDESAFYEYCQRRWDIGQSSIPDELRERLKTDIMLKLDQHERSHRRRLCFSRVKRTAWAAAVAVILIVAVQLGWNIAQREDSGSKPYIIEVVTEPGQKSNLTLPDGSRVWLNSASRISYTSDYNTKERNLSLEGEAYFDVAQGYDIPFVVKAKGLDVTALGTKFNVRAYAEDQVVIATLVEGKVRADADGQSQTLCPNQEAHYDRISGTVTRSYVQDESHIVPWMMNEILFQGESLAEIAVILERMYNVNVVFEDDCVKDYSYTGLIRNNSLTNVLELISGTSPVGYDMTSQTITFFMD